MDILAVYPANRFLGLAILDREDLIWHAVKSFSSDWSDGQTVRLEAQQQLTEILHRQPVEILAVGEPFYAGNRLRKLTEDLKTWGRWKGLAVRGYPTPTLKAFFCRDKKAYESVTEAMVRKYPRLRPLLDGSPSNEPYWGHVFGAVALGLMCQRKASAAVTEEHPPCPTTTSSSLEATRLRRSPSSRSISHIFT